MDKPRVTLHFGVHKTATTHIQSRLARSWDLLHANGIRYVRLGKLRQRLTSKLDNRALTPADVRHLTEGWLASPHLILSDENMLGGVEAPRENRLYPCARINAARLLEAHADCVCEVHLTFRTYADYLASRYAEFLRHSAFVPFETYFRQTDVMALSWLDLIDDLLAAGATRIRVTEFADLLRHETAYLNSLLGRSDLDLAPAEATPQTRRAKFSGEGYEVIRFFAQHYSAESAWELVRFLDNVPQTTPATVFMPFSAAQRAALDERYRREWAELPGRFGDAVVVNCFADAAAGEPA